jgi:hypothetical protein
MLAHVSLLGLLSRRDYHIAWTRFWGADHSFVFMFRVSGDTALEKKNNQTKESGVTSPHST